MITPTPVPRTTLQRPGAVLRRTGWLWSLTLSALFLPSGPRPALADAPPAGTQIGNQASASYTDSSNTERTATSNVAITIVQQVASFTLTTDGQAKYAAAGSQVLYPHTLINTGNGSDTFDLSAANSSGSDDFDLNSLALYADANGDGLPDNTTAVTSTGPLPPGGVFKFVVLGIVPGSETAGRAAAIIVTASGTTTATPAAAQNNTDTTTVTADAVVNVSAAMDSSAGAPGSGPYTITLTYNNTGNNSATNLTLLDVLPAGFTYVTNSARWSTLGSTPLTDATGDNQGAAPDTIDYDFGDTVAGRMKAIISRVQPGQSGTLTFQVTVGSAQPAGVINNTPTYSYDPGTGATVGPLNANTLQFTVTQSNGVDLTGQTIASATQGSTVSFTNVLQNTGNGTDTFDLTVSNTSFPAGTTFTLYQSDSNTPLVDSSGNGIPDSGPMVTSQTKNIILKAVLPNGASGAGVNYTVRLTATSITSSGTTTNVNDVLTSVTGNTVDLSNGPSGGAGAGPEVSPVVINTSNPNTTTRFTLYATNTSGVADSYNLTTSTNASFASLDLPSGWSVVFRDANEAIITSSGVLAAGTNKLIYADVTVAPGTAPGTNSIYFRVASSTSGASDRLHDAVAVNTVRNLSLAPNNTGQVFPNGFVVFSHLLINNGNVLEGDGTLSSVNLSLADSLSGWSSVLYYDLNSNGVVDGGDTAVTNLAFVSAGSAGVSPGESIRLLVKVYAPPGAAQGTINATTITATTANGTHTVAAPAAAVATDNSTVIAGDLQLLKEQALDADLNGTPDTAYTTTDITTGATPGKMIRYRITVTNRGTAPATAVKVYDTTPAYTIYTITGPASTTVGSVSSAPADGATGALEFDIGTLNPGASAVITFGVAIAQ